MQWRKSTIEEKLKLNNIFHFEEIDSTNTKAKEQLNTTPLPFIISANKQTHGRGRLGNTWVSDADSIYITFTFDISLYELHFYPYLSALAVHRFLVQKYLRNVYVKWPNDLLVSSKKISGILIEVVDQAIIIGIGININQHSEYFEKSNINGTSFHIETGKFFDVNSLRKDFIVSFYDTFTEYLTKRSRIFSDWESKCVHLYQNIRCRVGDYIKHGLFLSLGEQGELLLKTEKGIEKIHAGEILE